MLTIPDTIKALYRADGVRKNFRVHFPGGEMADITNSNIVKKSVSFTESLCSQDTFRFGLSEASVIEFETVGIGNMLGMQIECSIEIDTTSLSAAQISAIQAGTWDGELVLLADSDIGYGFYRIPYGIFTVDSCPRNHQAMTHRRVTAYSATYDTNYSMAPYERHKLAQGAGFGTKVTKRFTPSALRLIFESIGVENPAALEDAGFTKSVFNDWDNMNDNINVSTGFVAHLTSGSLLCTITYSYKEALYISDGNALYGLELNDLAETMRPVKAFLDNIYSTYRDRMQTPYTYWRNNGMGRFLPSISVMSNYDFLTVEDVPVFYPMFYMVSPSAPNGCLVRLPYKGTIDCVLRQGVTDTPVGSISFDLGAGTPPQVTQWNEPAGLNDIGLFFSPSGEQTDLATNVVYSTFTDAVNFPALLNGYLEALGVFLRPLRTGGTALKELDPASPTAVSAGETDELWWNEYDVSPIGTITFAYNGGEDGAVYEYNISAGSSVYDMTDNEILWSLDGANTNTVTQFLDNGIVTRAGAVDFTPVELTMIGLPWLESGDPIAITTEDGTVVNTYIMRQTIKGEQALFSNITSSGGELLEAST